VGLLAALAMDSPLDDTVALAVGLLNAIRMKSCQIEGPPGELTLLENLNKYYNDNKNGGRKL
jgi:hypothetical protein